MRFRRKNIRLHPAHYQGRAWYFNTLCCEFRRPVFSDSKNALKLIECLKTISSRNHFTVHAYCVMPDHFHALVEGIAPNSDLLLFVRNFKQASSRQHSKEDRVPLWQKKFYDHVLRPKESIEAVSWYIWMNPVRKGLSIMRNQYPYSGSFIEKWENRIQPEALWVPAWKDA